MPTLGYGNILTLVRGVVVGLLAGFIGLPRPLGWLAWLPAFLYTIGAITDHLDGYIARITDHVTGLGETLDMEFDVIGIFAAVLLAISYGQLPYWYLVIGFARELYLLGHWVLRRRGQPIYDLTPSADRRLIAGMQMGFLSVILWPLLTAPVTTVAAVMFAIPMVVSFGRDWLITTGVTSAQSPRYLLARRISKSVLQQWGPLWARLLGATALAALWQRLLHRGELWPPVGSEQPTLTVALILIGLIAGAGFCLGAVGRLCALVLVALLLIDVSVSGYSLVPHGLLLVAALYVLQFGSGRLALWQPEEALLRRRAGEESDDMPA